MVVMGVRFPHCFKLKQVMKQRIKSILLNLLYGAVEPKGEDVSQPMRCTVTMPESRVKLNIGSLYEQTPQF
jgi:hypothetical protein